MTVGGSSNALEYPLFFAFEVATVHDNSSWQGMTELPTKYEVDVSKRHDFALTLSEHPDDGLVWNVPWGTSSIAIGSNGITPEEFRNDEWRSPEALPVGIFFYSAFFTSAWLWLYAASVGVSRVLLRMNNGVGFLLRVTDVERQPFRSMGFVSVIIVSGLFAVGLPLVLR